MQSLVILIPVALALTGLAIWAFLWSVKNEQYDDLDRSARDILFDDETMPPPAQAAEQNAEADNQR